MAQATSLNQQGPSPAPKPPRKNPYRDGRSSCAQKYDLYEMIRNPTAHRNHRPPVANVNNDRPVSKQKKVEEEIRIIFEQNSPSLLWNRFKLLGKSIKMIFLTLVLPFYLILYIFPKIVFVKLIPFIVKKIRRYIIKSVERILAILNNFTNRLINPFKLLWTALRPSSKRKADELKQEFEETGIFSFIAMSLWYLLTPFVKGCYQAFSFTKKTVLNIKKFPQQLHLSFQSFLKNVKNYKNLIEKEFKRIVVSCKKKIHQVINSIVSYPSVKFKKIQLIMGSFFNFLMGKVRGKSIFFKKSILQFKAKIKNVLKINFQKIVSFITFFKLKLKLAIGWKKNIQVKSAPTLSALKNNFKLSLTYAQQAFYLPRPFIKQVQLHTVRSVKKSSIHMQTVARKFNTFFLTKKNLCKKWIISLLNRLKPILLVGISIKKFGIFIYHQAQKLTFLLINIFQIYFKTIKNKMIKACLLTKKGLNFFHSFLNLASYKTKIFNYIITLKNALKKRVEHFILHLRIAWAWTKILVVYGMYQAVIVTREIGLGL